MEVDIAPRNFPDREALIEGSIGELSPFHETFGFCVDGIDLRTIILPAGWQDRVVIVDNPNTNGYRGLCLGPEDLAASKLAVGRDKDIEYVRILFRERMARPSDVERRIAALSALEPADRDGLIARLRGLLRG